MNASPGNDPLPHRLALFPLPETVFFPHTLLPLHVFEERYRRLVEDLQASSGWVAVPLMAERERSLTPGFHAVAGAGPIRECESLPDGRYNIVIDGRARVLLEEIPADTPYRMARATRQPEGENWLHGEEAEASLGHLLRMGRRLGIARFDQGVNEIIAQPEVRRILVNRFAMAVPMEVRERQALLEMADYQDRLERLLDHLSSAQRIQNAVQGGQPGDPGLN